MAKVIDPVTVEARTGTIYPKELAKMVEGRSKRALTDLMGLTQFGVNVTTLAPGAASSHRHWHMAEDEFCYILDGDITLISNEGEQVLKPGTAVAFPANEENGHQLVNKSAKPVTYLEIGTRAQVDQCTYPDVDMHATKVGGKFAMRRKNGRPFE